MTTLCCISLTIAARIIAALGLSTAILMINVVVSEYFVRIEDDEFLTAIKSWTLIGLNWTRCIKSLKLTNEVQVTFICLLSYATLLLTVNGLLAIGTIYKKSKHALPWMYVQIFSIADQMTSVIIFLTSSSINSNQTSQIQASSPLSCIYLITNMYFWLIVFSAREQWIRKSELSLNNGNPSAIITEPPRDSNVPKTPSYLSQNQSFFQPVVPEVSNKPDNL
ncbi:uncharacterized protein [Chelonus insularis]|uniref:uncharacterized protein n=1 Tax=Chelonus insularis TaxID=460826 RepID=UPI00158CE84F|nr:uncharacterized protein LOC118072985 [Chelonus insularis]